MIIMMIFNMSTSYFYKFSFHYFEDNLMMKVTLGIGTQPKFKGIMSLSLT
jgi:hypothetical protein